MPWFKIDDGFHGHPKVMNLTPADVGIWTLAGTWCASYLTDGKITLPVVMRLGGTEANCAALVAAGMWIPGDGGSFQFKDWEDYQPMKADVEAEREASRERMRKVRAKRKGTTSDDSEDVQPNTSRTSEEVRLTPTQPDPTRPPSSKEEGNPREDVEKLCTTLRDLMVSNGFKEPKITEAWRKEARLLLDKDGREQDKALNVMRWAQGNSFWKPNIKSMGKFRDQYDTLRLQALDEWQKGKSKVNPDGGDIDPDAILGKDYWTPGDPPEGLDIQEEIAWKKEQRAQHQAERMKEAKRRLEESNAATA